MHKHLSQTQIYSKLAHEKLIFSPSMHKHLSQTQIYSKLAPFDEKLIFTPSGKPLLTYVLIEYSALQSVMNKD